MKYIFIKQMGENRPRVLTALTAFYISDNDKFTEKAIILPTKKQYLRFALRISMFCVIVLQGWGVSEKSPDPLTRDTHLSYLVPAGTSPVYLFVYVLQNTMSFLQTFLKK